MKTITTLAAAAGLLAMAAAPASAQSTEEVLATVIGGSVGAVIGGELDYRGSRQEGEIIGALVGGSLGYIVGDQIDDRNDRNARRDFYRARQYGNYYRQPTYQRPVYGYHAPRYSQRRGHPVHARHPGRGRAVGHYRR